MFKTVLRDTSAFRSILVACLSSVLLASQAQADAKQPQKEMGRQNLNRYLPLLNAAYPCDWTATHDDYGNYRMKFGVDVQVLDFSCTIIPYNSAHLFVRVDEKNPDSAQLLTFERPSGENNGDPKIVFNGVWHIKTGDLTSFTKGHPLGDCGTYEVHRFTPDGYPHLIEFRSKPNCDGNYMKPEEYPVIFKAGN
ncbi:hypothetical protein PsAD2_02772 [Pseudovibrio axinellae]|uniref:DUF1176 domain-containing protein n=1 Tax=Pseudovibrio axinellae TaxID=989403 RepID=A0A165XU21_9HYPH|nr:DUF1176 domain-containing protein [Pseudovibrio axinellae]KZL18038.1 hypothetical protein PsAD2_02772 [Pseudovibrio axinellae]SER12636.1 Protein of unknown function [Pseudovibrio axinellae]